MFEDMTKGLAVQVTESADDEWFNIEDGTKKIRVLSEGKLFQRWYDGTGYKTCVDDDGRPDDVKPQTRWMTQVLDGGKIKLANMPWGFYSEITNLQKDEDWGFDSMPMEYDVSFTVQNAGTTSVKYSVVPSPKKEAISEDVKADLEEASTPADVVEAMQNKRKKELDSNGEDTPLEYPKADINPEDVPF